MVTALDSRADRLDFCRDHLAEDYVVQLGADTPARLSDLTGGDFFDVVFDATGNPKAMEAGFAYVGHGGTYVLISVVGRRHHLFRPRVPQARDHPAGQPQRHAGGLRHRGRGHAGGPGADQGAEHPRRHPGPPALGPAGLDGASGGGHQGDRHMLIDAHQHFWRVGQNGFLVADAGPGGDPPRLRPHRPRRGRRPVGLAGSVVVQSQADDRDTDWLLRLAADDAPGPGRRGLADLASPSTRRTGPRELAREPQAARPAPDAAEPRRRRLDRRP